jgi:CheY-like chemotaxis protein
MAAGFDPLVCTNGADALQAIAAQNSDLVVLDLGLPEVDGWAILGRLRAKPRTSSVPVLIVTRRGDAADSEAGRSEWLPLQTLRRRQVSQPGQRARRSRVGKATDGPVRTRVTDHERDPLSIFRCAAFGSAAPVASLPPSPLRRLRQRRASRQQERQDRQRERHAPNKERGTRNRLRRSDPIGEDHLEAGAAEAF